MEDEFQSAGIDKYFDLTKISAADFLEKVYDDLEVHDRAMPERSHASVITSLSSSGVPFQLIIQIHNEAPYDATIYGALN